MSGIHEPVLGVDVGGVLMQRMSDETDTSFAGSNYLLTPAIAEAFDSLRKLTDKGFRIYLVSKCGKTTEEKTRNWLEYHDFYTKTGIAPDNLRFCRKRNEKAQICAELGATHFIDDRLEVLSYLTSVLNLYLFNPEESEVQQFSHVLPRVTRVSTWQEVTSLLLETIELDPVSPL